MKILEVAFPIPVFSTYHYLGPESVSLLSRVKVPFGRSTRIGYVISFPQEPSDAAGVKLKEICSVIDSEALLTPSLLELARRMSRRYAIPLGEVLGTILPPFIKPSMRPRRDSSLKNISPETGFLLTESQKKALEPVINNIKKGKHSIYLLEGVTASGKTEIYMNLISFLIEQGRQTMLLVPEIAVTAQLTEMFFNRFGSSAVDIWHSRITPARKMEIIRRIKGGRTKILIGTRSAVFAPFKDPGAIIIDEEQDDTYKESQSPYYDARWVARTRCDIEKAQLILASATPSVNTYTEAVSDKITHLKIKERVYRKDLPEVTLVDMRKEEGWMFSRYLINKMEAALKNKKQIMIFVNRRGFSGSVLCSLCGENIKCPRCSITLTMHQVREKKLHCHICSHSAVVHSECPSCGGALLKYRGFGTQRVEKALRKFFPEAEISRMDADTTRKKGEAQNIYNSFANGKTDILVGTVLIAMGWDFPEVSLVGVLDADSLLFLPDFRASEKNYVLLKQVSGRSGRRGNRGEVVIQSYNPSHYSVRLQLDNNYESFYREEIEVRKTAGFPPFRELVNVVCSHKKSARAQDAASYVSNYVSEHIPDAEVLGPAPAPVYRMRENYRWQVIIKYAPENDISEKLIGMKKSNPVRSVKIKIDIDPYNML